MMLHDKMLNGQFILDMKKDFTPSPETSPSPTKMDFYNAFRFRAMQQIEDAEALDLSRRDSVETRKTPSPYNTTCSLGTGSPSTHCGSPASTLQAGQILQNNLLYGSNLSTTTTIANNGFLPAAMAASLYPMYYPKIKQEIQSPPLPSNNNHFPGMYGSSTTNLLQSMNTIKNTIQMPLQNENRPRMDKQERFSDISSPNSSFSAPPAKVQKLNNNTDVKSTRPFKAFPRDPLVIAANFAASDVLLDNPRVERYTEYRKRVLEQIRSSNGGHRTVTNPKMRRNNVRQNSHHEGSNSDNHHSANSESEDRAAESSDNDSTPGNFANINSTSDDMANNNMDHNPNGIKDAAYFERRRKNNAAAKKSRDRRRIKEDEIAIRAAYLERQNIELLCQIDSLKAQLAAANANAHLKC